MFVGITEIEKRKCHHLENLILLEDVDIYNILRSTVIALAEKISKYVIGKKDNYDFQIKPLLTMLPKTSTYEKCYDDKINYDFMVKDYELLKKHNDIWNKVSNNIKNEFDCKPIYNKNVLKIQLRLYGDEATDFHT